MIVVVHVVMDNAFLAVVWCNVYWIQQKVETFVPHRGHSFVVGAVFFDVVVAIHGNFSVNPYGAGGQEGGRANLLI